MKLLERSKINEKAIKELGIAAVVILLGLLVGVGGVSGATTVSSCQVINQSGVYTLTGNITDISAAKCIEITASNVVFDGAAHPIDGKDNANTYAVYVYNASATLVNVTVRNLEVTDWAYGIYFWNVEYGAIKNTSVISNTQWGI